jgi:hypothetical protein
MVDVISFWIMNATADDWESLDQIVPQVLETCSSVDSKSVAERIEALVGQGLMEEMRGRAVRSADVLVDPMEFWFRMTLKGRSTWSAMAEKGEA